MVFSINSLVYTVIDMLYFFNFRLIGGLVTLSSQFSFVVENDDGVCGYILATPDANDFHRKMSVSWLPEMQKKYPLPVETDNTSLTKAQVCTWFIACSR